MSATVPFGPRSVRRWTTFFAAAAVVLSLLLPDTVVGAVGLTFTTQPGASVYSQPFGPEAVVAIRDGGTVITSASGTVTMSLLAGTGTPGAALTCTGGGPGGRTFDLVQGVATATGCAIDHAGLGYRMAATWSQGGTTLTNPFDVYTGPAAQLGFATQPDLAVSGVAFRSQPVVEVQDAAGQRIASSSASVTLDIANGTGVAGALLHCQASNISVASAGLASFSGCSIDRNGLGFALRATSPGLSPGTSTGFGVASPVPARLGFVVQPGRGRPGLPLADQPAVAIEDSDGLIIPTASPTTITLYMGANPGQGALSCGPAPQRTTVNGLASFSGCSIDRTGNGFSIIASAAGLLSTTSVAFDVADRLSFLLQPASGRAGESFAVGPMVVIYAGPYVAASHDQGTNVALSIKLGTGTVGAILTCDGGTTTKPINGVAQFGTCMIDRPGTGYVLYATSPGLTGAATSPFSVAPGSFTVIPSAAVIAWGASVTLSIDFRPLSGSGAGRVLSVFASRDQAAWYSVGTVTTSELGHASLVYRPAPSLFYRATFAGTVDLAGAISPQTHVTVRQVTTLGPSTGGVALTIRRGTSITFTARVGPAQPDLPRPQVSFLFYRRIGSAWVRVAIRVATASSTGVARSTWTFQTLGPWYVRAVANATPYNASSVASRPLTYVVQ